MATGSEGEEVAGPADEPAAPSVPSAPQSELIGRSCWVCFGTDQDEPQSPWLSPCKCSGSAKWVHDSCLQRYSQCRWVDEKQKGNLISLVRCAQCNALYRLVLPAAGRLVQLLELLDRQASRAAPLLTVVAVAGGFYLFLLFHGTVSVLLVVGQEDGFDLFDRVDHKLQLLLLPQIPVLLLAANMVHWQEPLADVLYKSLSRPDEEQGKRLEAIFQKRPRNVTRLFVGALCLPLFAFFTGQLIFFRRPAMPLWRKSLVGGLVFCLVKGVTNIYYRYRQVGRYSNRRILNYEDDETAQP